jgi:hypothetical protein
VERIMMICRQLSACVAARKGRTAMPMVPAVLCKPRSGGEAKKMTLTEMRQCCSVQVDRPRTQVDCQLESQLGSLHPPRNALPVAPCANASDRLAKHRRYGAPGYIRGHRGKG